VRNEQDNWICTECGYTSSKRFVGDICPNCGMTYWHCKVCGYTMVSAVCPDVCPDCNAKGEFINITCYIPGWREVDALNSNF
jgi:rubrerythrin